MARTKPTYISAIVSVALVLFMVGFFALTALHARKLVSLFKEKVDIWLELSPDARQTDVSRIIAGIRQQPFVKKETVVFITREQAVAQMKADLGDTALIADLPNMLRDVVRFNVEADFLSPDSLASFRETLRRDSLISDLHFEQAETGNIGRNIEKLGWLTLALGFLLIFAAIALIHNTIRLALFSNRFLIKNQELVGASWEFISRPYIQRGILNGFWSALLAIGLLIGLLSVSQRQMPELEDLEDVNGMLAVFAGLTLLGVLISGLSTYWVVKKFLRMRVDDLY